MRDTNIPMAAYTVVLDFQLHYRALLAKSITELYKYPYSGKYLIQLNDAN